MVTIPVDFVLDDPEKIKILSKSIVNDIQGLISQPTTMSVKEFSEIEKISVSFIKKNRKYFCVECVPGSDRLYINMVAWRKQLEGVK